ncbi:MAG TPA: MFS transporter [Candidatus Acidoferrum sp.]|nr:MFS transporter [Candidatus Acidoferrum sp.]
MIKKRFNRDRFIYGVSFNVLILGVVSLFADMSTEMIYPLVPLFLINVLGASFIDVGVIEGIAESTASIFKIISGYISDKFGKRKPLVYSGYGIAAIAKPLLALTTAWQQVLGLRFIDRLGKGVRDSARDAIISESGGKGAGRSFGFQRSLDTLGAIIGPLIAASLFIYLSYKGLFLLAFIPGLFATLLVVFFVKDATVGTSEGRLYQISFKSFDRNFKILLIGLALFFIGNSSDAFLFLRAQNLGIITLFIPVLYLTSNLIYALTSFPFGILSDKIGRKKVLLLGYSIFSLVYLGFALANSSILMWTLFPVYGLYYGLTDGVSKALVSDLAPTALKATAFGTYYTVIGIVALPASLIAGTLWQALGPQFAFFYGAIMSVAAILTIGLFVKKIEPNKG